MCGIIGYIGSQPAVPILLKGLERLEYRGYDSAGIAVFDGSSLQVRKARGRLANLCRRVEDQPLSGFAGIGHTRWATHGRAKRYKRPSSFKHGRRSCHCT